MRVRLLLLMLGSFLVGISPTGTQPFAGPGSSSTIGSCVVLFPSSARSSPSRADTTCSDSGGVASMTVFSLPGHVGATSSAASTSGTANGVAFVIFAQELSK